MLIYREVRYYIEEQYGYCACFVLDLEGGNCTSATLAANILEGGAIVLGFKVIQKPKYLFFIYYLLQ